MGDTGSAFILVEFKNAEGKHNEEEEQLKSMNQGNVSLKHGSFPIKIGQ